MANRTRGRHWLLTLPSNDSKTQTRISVEQVLARLKSSAIVQTYIFQLECGEGETQYLHYQLYLETSLTEFKNCKRIFPRAHIERCRSPKSAKLYCMKQSTRVEGPWHNISEFQMSELQDTMRKKSSQEELLSGIQSMSINSDEIAKKNFGFWLRNHRGIEAWMKKHQQTRKKKTITIYIYGRTGIGKSRLAYDIAMKWSTKDPYYKDDTEWWELYENQEVVVWDDLRSNSIKYSELLKLCDRYPYKVNVKGSIREFTSRLIIFTSNVSAKKVMNVIESSAWERRIDISLKITKYDGKELIKINEDGEKEKQTLNELMSDIYDEQ